MDAKDCLKKEIGAYILPDKSPAKAISDLGSTVAKTVGFST